MTQRDNKMNVSVIVTALNEQENIIPTINNILKSFVDFNIGGEIVVINDGSTDKTGDLVNSVVERDNRVRILNHDSPRGVGQSFWDGVNIAKGTIVVWMPGDNENDPWEIFRYYNLLEHVDIVIPFIFNKEVRSLFRNALSFVYRFIINTTFAVNFNYTNGTILYRKSILNNFEYRSNGFFFQTDILIRAAKKGFLFAEVPYRLCIREHGVSKAVTFPSLLKVINGYFILVRDFYFKKGARSQLHFPEDSLTAIRRK